jgi:putative transposase
MVYWIFPFFSEDLMVRKRKTYSSAFKAKVALAAVRGDMTLSQLAAKFGVHVNQISKWKARLLERMPDLFEQGKSRAQQESTTDEARLYEQIGRLKMEIDWLKKKSDQLD